MTATSKYYEQGQRARLNGKPQSACRYKQPHMRGAWLHGWLDYDGQLAKVAAARAEDEKVFRWADATS